MYGLPGMFPEEEWWEPQPIPSLGDWLSENPIPTYAPPERTIRHEDIFDYPRPRKVSDLEPEDRKQALSDALMAFGASLTSGRGFGGGLAAAGASSKRSLAEAISRIAEDKKDDVQRFNMESQQARDYNYEYQFELAEHQRQQAATMESIKSLQENKIAQTLAPEIAKMEDGYEKELATTLSDLGRGSEASAVVGQYTERLRKGQIQKNELALRMGIEAMGGKYSEGTIVQIHAAAERAANAAVSDPLALAFAGIEGDEAIAAHRKSVYDKSISAALGLLDEHTGQPLVPEDIPVDTKTAVNNLMRLHGGQSMFEEIEFEPPKPEFIDPALRQRYDQEKSELMEIVGGGEDWYISGTSAGAGVGLGAAPAGSAGPVATESSFEESKPNTVDAGISWTQLNEMSPEEYQEASRQAQAEREKWGSDLGLPTDPEMVDPDYLSDTAKGAWGDISGTAGPVLSEIRRQGSAVLGQAGREMIGDVEHLKKWNRGEGPFLKPHQPIDLGFNVPAPGPANVASPEELASSYTRGVEPIDFGGIAGDVAGGIAGEIGGAGGGIVSALKSIGQGEQRPRVANKMLPFRERGVSPGMKGLPSDIPLTTAMKRKAIDTHIAEAAREYGLEEDLVRAVVKTESDFESDAVSHMGAQGLMQLMPATAAELGLKGESVFDAKKNVRAGTKYLAGLIDRFGLEWGLAAYNAGMGNVQRWLDQGITDIADIPDEEGKNFAETRAYVPKVLGYMRR